MDAKMVQIFALVAVCFSGVSGLAVESRAIYGSQMALVVQNRHHEPIVMSDDSYTLMSEESTLVTGQHKIFTTGPWSGNLKVNNQKHGNTGQDTLLEFTVNNQGITFDVSFVAGFTVPAVCGCKVDGAQDVELVTGCNIDLKKLNGGKCPPASHNGRGGCMNPMRAQAWDVGAAPFFQPCEGAGYTHEGDHLTTQNGDLCRKGPIVCCIGNECPPSMKQKNFNGTATDMYSNGGTYGAFNAAAYHGAQTNSDGTFLSLNALLDVVHLS